MGLRLGDGIGARVLRKGGGSAPTLALAAVSFSYLTPTLTLWHFEILPAGGGGGGEVDPDLENKVTENGLI